MKFLLLMSSLAFVQTVGNAAMPSRMGWGSASYLLDCQRFACQNRFDAGWSSDEVEQGLIGALESS